MHMPACTHRSCHSAPWEGQGFAGEKSGRPAEKQGRRARIGARRHGCRAAGKKGPAKLGWASGGAAGQSEAQGRRARGEHGAMPHCMARHMLWAQRVASTWARTGAPPRWPQCNRERAKCRGGDTGGVAAARYGCRGVTFPTDPTQHTGGWQPPHTHTCGWAQFQTVLPMLTQPTACVVCRGDVQSATASQPHAKPPSPPIANALRLLFSCTATDVQQAVIIRGRTAGSPARGR